MNKRNSAASLQIIGATPTSLTLPQKTTFGEWKEIGYQLARAEKSLMWWIGEWWRFGEQKYGERAKAALESEFKFQTWANAAWVAGKIETSRRREVLSWSHHAEVAGLPPKEQDRLLGEAEENDLSVRDIRRAARLAKLGQIREVPLPKGKFRVIYADPPWWHTNEDPAHGTTPGDYYPLMPTPKICALPIGELAYKNSILFLWTTSPHLRESMDVLEAWGFEYKTSFIWDKVKHNCGYYNSVRHEQLLICTKGSCTPDVPKLFDSVQTIKSTGEHSEKPERFREIIDILYPPPKKHIDRIELFARGGIPSHWEPWGNQAVARAG